MSSPLQTAERFNIAQNTGGFHVAFYMNLNCHFSNLKINYVKQEESILEKVIHHIDSLLIFATYFMFNNLSYTALSDIRLLV